MTTRDVAIKILTNTSLDGLTFRNRYVPKVCFKCGKILDGFYVQTNGNYHCLSCDLPIKKNRDEIKEIILNTVIKGLEKDGPETIQHILKELN